MRNPYPGLALALVLASTLPANAEHEIALATSSTVGISAARLEKVGGAIRAEIDKGAIPGAVVAIARKGKLVYHESFGFLDKAKGAAMPKDAIFPIASMTKPLTAVGALMLMEEGRMYPGDPIGMYLPQLAAMRVVTETGTEPARRQPTLQDLMRHTAGLTYGVATGSELYKRYAELIRPERTPAEFIERLSKLPLHYHPGARWDYGLGHEVMGVIIESLTKQRLADYLSERLFQPLGMTDTGFHVAAAKAVRVARPLEKDPVTGQAINTTTRTQPPNLDNGGGGAYSTAMDYLRFAEMLRNHGTVGDRRYLGRKTVDFMTSDQITPDVSLDRFWGRENVTGYGFGSSVAVRRTTGHGGMIGSPGDYHWGGASGTYFWVDPKEELTVVFMAAAPGATRVRMRQLITTMVLQALE
jgi:CubicO group peptidase (beta-lactamase class C family)